MRLCRTWLVLVVLVSTVPAGGLELMVPLQPVTSADIYPGVSLRIRRVLVHEGDRVAIGDTLALLDDTELRLSEEAAALACRQSSQRLARGRRAHARGLISTQQLESLECDADADRVRWQRARLDLARAAVLAPIPGLVSLSSASPGDLTSPRALLFQIIATEDLQAELFVPAGHVRDLTPGQAIAATSTLPPEPSITGRIVRVSPVIDPRSGTCKVLALFPGAGRTVKPGTVVRVILEGAVNARRP